MSESAIALQRQVEVLGETAKLAIRRYKQAILQEPASTRVRRVKMEREVERAVFEYIQLRRRLDELRAQMTVESGGEVPLPPDKH